MVFDEEDKYTGDRYYRTRHQHIADVLFENVLVDANDRFDYYLSILQSLDIGYTSDREAFKGMTRARDLMRLFPDIETIRQLYDTAAERSPDDPKLLQQEAIFEMNKGDIERGERLLTQASELAPWDKTIVPFPCGASPPQGK